MDDGAVPQSLFVVVSWDITAPCRISILQLETRKHNQDEYAAAHPGHLTRRDHPHFRFRSSFSFLESQLNQKEYVAHFTQPQWSSERWVFSPLTNSDLCMLPYSRTQKHETDIALHGSVFNFRTKTCRPMPPIAMKIGHVVTLGGAIYVLAQPNGCCDIPYEEYDPLKPFKRYDIAFRRYDPARGFWQYLNPFPGHAAYKLRSKANRIVATAVLKDTILFNMGSCEIWAYDVGRDKWCPVTAKDNPWCCSIEGEAVVLDNTIYALTTLSSKLVLALSIRREDGDHGFVCSLHSKIFVDIKPISFIGANWGTRHLVHLGKDNFCLVQSCLLTESSSSNGYQPIQLTNIKLIEVNSVKSMTVIDTCIHLLRIPDLEQFSVKFCFSLPECKTTALKEGNNFCFNLDPYPEGYDPKQKFKTDSVLNPKEEFKTLPEDGPLAPSELYTIPAVQEDVPTISYLAKSNSGAFETIYTEAEGLPISADATFGQIKNEFGLSKRLEIQFIIDGETVSAMSLISEGFQAEMEEKRSNGLPGHEADISLISEGFQAEMEEKRSNGLTGHQADMSLIREGFQAEMEEKRSNGLTGHEADMSLISEGFQAEMEEKRSSVSPSQEEKKET